jgi:5'-methylthioadenosine phosphorylase
LCTGYDTPGDPARGHWIFDQPFSASLRRSLITAARELGVPVREGGCYGHVDGPRFNSRTEVAELARAGVCAISQTGGPETVLAGELELPFALVGFVTDRANGVSSAPEPMHALVARMDASTGIFASLIERAIPRLPGADVAGIVYRIES